MVFHDSIKFIEKCIQLRGVEWHVCRTDGRTRNRMRIIIGSVQTKLTLVEVVRDIDGNHHGHHGQHAAAEHVNWCDGSFDVETVPSRYGTTEYYYVLLFLKKCSHIMGDDDEAFISDLPSDTDAALSYLLAQCPAAMRPSSVPVVLLSQLYAVVKDRTEVDQEIEKQRLAHEIRLLQLPSLREERLILRAAQYAQAMAADSETATLSACDSAALILASKTLDKCTGVSVRRFELESALGSEMKTMEVIGILESRGWLYKSPRISYSHPEDADLAINDDWLWALPECGKLMRAVIPLRSEILKTLHKQRLGKALRITIERSSNITKLLRSVPIDFTFALRDLVGCDYIQSSESAAGVVLQLTPAGFRAAAAVAQSKKRGRQP